MTLRHAWLGRALTTLRPDARNGLEYVVSAAEDGVPELTRWDAAALGPLDADAVLAEAARLSVAVPTERLAKARANGVAAAKAFAQHCLQTIAGQTFDGVDAAGWVAKAECARRIMAGTQSAVDLDVVAIEAESRAKGETPQQLVAKWAAKDGLYRKAVAYVDGFMSRTVDAVLAAPSPEAVDVVLAAMKPQAEALLAQFLASMPQG
jgi:hypothetical protein